VSDAAVSSGLPALTPRLAVVVVGSCLVLVVVGAPVLSGLLAVNVLLAVVVAVDLALAPAPGTLPVRRTLPGAVALGASATVGWEVRNPGGRPTVVSLADELAPSLRAGTRRVHMALGPRGRGEASTVIAPTRRGRFDVVNLSVRATGPLGLAARQCTRREPAVLRVYPSFRSRDEAELRLNRARILEVGLRSARGIGGGTEFDQLREYTVDDESRRIDWAATARSRRPVVRTYRAERNQTVICLLDAGRVMAGRVGGVPRLEYAMDAVMTLTYVATRLGDRAGLVAFDQEVRSVVAASHGRHQLGRVTEAMYALEPQLAESDYRGAFVHTLARFRRRTMLVIATDLVEQAVGESLLPALPLLTRHHLVVVAAVRDPEVVAWSRQTPTDASGAYRQAAAIVALEERARTAARLRSLGVQVVDEAPEQLAPRLADAYLSVKAVGRL
jgi:uncharacterized protein (DUF58 family)